MPPKMSTQGWNDGTTKGERRNPSKKRPSSLPLNPSDPSSISFELTVNEREKCGRVGDAVRWIKFKALFNYEGIDVEKEISRIRNSCSGRNKERDGERKRKRHREETTGRTWKMQMNLQLHVCLRTWNGTTCISFVSRPAAMSCLGRDGIRKVLFSVLKMLPTMRPKLQLTIKDTSCKRYERNTQIRFAI